MKKKIIFLAVIAIQLICLSTKAQIVVVPSGATHVGSLTMSDTTAAVQIAAINNLEPKISFGDAGSGFCSIASVGREDAQVHLYGKRGVKLSVQNDVALRCNTENYQVNVPQPFTTRAMYIAADPQLVESGYGNISSALDLLNGLTAKSYRLIVRPFWADPNEQEQEEPGPEDPGDRGLRDVGDIIEQDIDSLHYGIQVSAIEATLPHLVTTDEEGFKYVDYGSLVALLVSAVNELRAELDALQSAPDRAPMIESAPTTNINSISADVIVPTLAQNRPNPFNEDTYISVTLPLEVGSATVYVYDLQGHQILSIPVNERGNTSVTINGSELPAGMYIYNLIADGREIDSKRMVLTK